MQEYVMLCYVVLPTYSYSVSIYGLCKTRFVHLAFVSFTLRIFDPCNISLVNKWICSSSYSS
uniref:Uncharacterized protein n=1 Tax=Arundo donax TaxID=35708 RepID=A0A0A9EID3_ARUDO